MNLGPVYILDFATVNRLQTLVHQLAIALDQAFEQGCYGDDDGNADMAPSPNP